MKIEVSNGEILDKITILAIKKSIIKSINFTNKESKDIEDILNELQKGDDDVLDEEY